MGVYINSFLILVVLLQLFVFQRFIKRQIEKLFSYINNQAAVIYTTDEENLLVKEYIDKYNKYQEKNNEFMANLVLRNAFLNNPGNKKIFKKYINYLLNKAKAEEELETKSDYIEDAFNSILTFSEYTNIDNFGLVEDYIGRVNKLREELVDKSVQQINLENEDIIKKLKSLLEELKKIEDITEDKVRNILEEAASLEAKLEPRFLSDELGREYNELKKEYEEQAIIKGEILNEAKYREYNQEIVNKLNDMFQEFKDHEKDYKNSKKDIVELIDNSYGISKVNTQYLNSETLTYFNYIYSYIFGVIKDKDKFRLTECMTKSKKDLLG